MIDLLTIPPSEAERLAYAEGFTMAAELFQRIDLLQRQNEALRDALDDLHGITLEDVPHSRRTEGLKAALRIAGRLLGE